MLLRPLPCPCVFLIITFLCSILSDYIILVSKHCCSAIYQAGMAIKHKHFFPKPMLHQFIAGVISEAFYHRQKR